MPAWIVTSTSGNLNSAFHSDGVLSNPCDVSSNTTGPSSRRRLIVVTAKSGLPGRRRPALSIADGSVMTQSLVSSSIHTVPRRTWAPIATSGPRSGAARRVVLAVHHGHAGLLQELDEPAVTDRRDRVAVRLRRLLVVEVVGERGEPQRDAERHHAEADQQDQRAAPERRRRRGGRGR